jgi:acyl-CoA thioesterase-1
MNTQSPTPQDPSFAPPDKIDPLLPNILIIGDSISMGYTLPVRVLLKDIANTHRIPENGGPITNGLSKIDRWVGDTKWKVIHFNFGLHDLKIMPDGGHQVPLSEYEAMLRSFVHRLKKTNAKLVWASTTPVPSGKLSPLRKPGDEVKYNEAAKRIMSAERVAVNDLYTLAHAHLAEWQRPANVHFTDTGSQGLAEKVARTIKEQLAQK